MSVNYSQAVNHAKILRSIGGSNPEYDRALVELIASLFQDRDTEQMLQKVANDTGIVLEREV